MPIYMHIEGIEGDSLSESHRGDFEVYSFSWGESNPRTNAFGGGATGRVSMSDFNIMKPAGKGSPPLFLACASGRHLPAVQIVVTIESSDRETNLQRYRLQDVVVSSYQTGGDGNATPTESLTLNFTRIEFTQWLVGPNGGVGDPQIAFWDLRNNTGG